MQFPLSIPEAIKNIQFSSLNFAIQESSEIITRNKKLLFWQWDIKMF